MKYYSATTNGFYSLGIHTEEQLPKDVVEVTEEEWRALMVAQEQGAKITADFEGRPTTTTHGEI